MANFDPKLLVPASKSKEFNGAAVTKTPKSILAAGIDKQIALFKKPSEEGRRWFTLGDKEVAIRLKFANKAIPLAGNEDTVVVPRDQFEGAMLYLKGEAEKGAYDAPLAELAKGREDRTNKMRATRAAKKAAAPKDEIKS
jgi:hypothetical protein